MRKFKKITSLCLSVVMAFSLMTVGASASDDISNFNVSEEQATKIAINFVISRAHAEDTDETFPVPFKVVKDETLYNLDDEVTAYKFNVVDIDGDYSGYVIAGASRDVAPIIEYSCSDAASFIDVAEDAILATGDKAKLYYDGGLDYYIEKSDDAGKALFDVSAKKELSASKTELKTAKQKLRRFDESANYEKEWDNALGAASNPPTNTYISDPLNHESGYTGYTMKYIAGATANMYRLMSSFSDGCGFHCGPTAATNLCILNYELNGKTNLKSSTWDNTFTTLHTLAQCDCGPYGTYDNVLTTAIRTYGRNRGYSSTTATRDTTPTVNEMKNSIYNNVPQILLVNGHGYYGDHYVMTVGVEQYNYTNGTTTYFRVIDGWSTSPRYINFNSNYMTSTITANFN